jgi:hypothetical protein
VRDVKQQVIRVRAGATVGKLGQQDVDVRDLGDDVSEQRLVAVVAVLG